MHAKSVSRRYSSSGIPMSRLLGVILASSRVRLRCSARARVTFTKRWMGAAMMTERWSAGNDSGLLLEAVEEPIGPGGSGHRQRPFLLQTQACSNQLDMQQRAYAGRRAVDPLIEVETPTWSQARSSIGVGERTAGMVGRAYAVQTAGNGGSELLIFVP